MFKRKPGKKSTFEKAIQYYLDGDIRDSALEFAAWSRVNGLAPRQNGGPAHWKIPWKDFYLCCIRFDPNKWNIRFFAGNYSGEHDEEFIKAVQDHVGPCVACMDQCPKGKDMTIFGKDFANLCVEFTVQFENPDRGSLEHIKKLLEYWKTAGPSDSWHYRD